MTDLHPTVRRTDELRTAAEALRDLGFDAITGSDDPLTVIRNLHATFEALKEAWPAVSQAAGFEDPFGDGDTSFTDEVKRGIQLAVEGTWDARNSI